MVAYRWWFLFRVTELERYRKFGESLVWVMYLAHLFIFLVLMEKKKLALVRASGKRK
jgi:hypothetical protein